MSPRIVVLLASLAFGLSASAARSVRTIYFKKPADAPAKIHLCDEKNVIELPLPPMNLSSRRDLPAGDLVFRCLLEPPGEDQPLPANAPVVRIAKAWTDVILLFAPNPKSKKFPFYVAALDASASSFHPGELLCFNRTTATLGGIVGTRKVRVDPGKMVRIKPPAAKASDYRVMINYMLPGEKRSRPLTRTSWRHEPMVRHLLFVLADPVRKVPRIWSVPDRIPPPEDEQGKDEDPQPEAPLRQKPPE